jgi:hypothetical protein
MVKALEFIIVVSLLGMSPCAHAQGTSQQNSRGGYVGSSAPGAAAATSNSNPSVIAPRNSMGASQSREGTLGLTPQHQKELGISKQQ